MASFSYTGLKKNQKVIGAIDAEDKIKATSKLKEQGITVTKIEIQKSNDAEEEALPEPKFFMGMQLESDKVTEKDVLDFTNKLKTMINANLPIYDCLKLLRKQNKKPGMIKITKSLLSDLDQGLPFSHGLEKFPDTFNESYLNMVKAGEKSGTLGTFLTKINEMVQAQMKIVKEIKGAITYPVILLSVASLVTIVMLVKVVPVFQEIYESMGVELPDATQKIIAASEFMQGSGGAITVLSIIIFFVGFKQGIKRSYMFRKKWHSIILKLPALGTLIEKSIYAQMGMVLGNLLTAGVSIIEALDIASKVTTNVVVRESTERIKNEVLTGKSLSQLFATEKKVFPMEFSEFMKVGEKTGSVEQMFFSIADFYGAEVEEAVEKLKQFIEPVMILLIGSIIMVLLLALYQPIFSMGDAIK
ncbi:type II secretion system F family protein [Pelagibacteraceae bacterium]|nr:type II secretion system F family protein [Pelagibacteraceae bacterium]